MDEGELVSTTFYKRKSEPRAWRQKLDFACNGLELSERMALVRYCALVNP